MIALIVSAVITPDATLFTMMLMAIPLIVLYEAGIWGARWFGRRSVPLADEPDEADVDAALDDLASPPSDDG